MLDFRRPKIEDRDAVVSRTAASGKQGDECAFANVFLFRDRYDIEICFFGGFFIQTYWSHSKNCGYNFPVGSGNIEGCLSAILEDAHERGRTPRIWLMSDEEAELLTKLYPGMFVIEEARDDFDYIYRQEDLSLLSGKKYQSKRNHISRFTRDFPNWRYEPLSKENFSDAVRVAEEWHVSSGKSAVDLEIELEALSDAEKYFDDLRLSGGLLYVDGRPVAMTVASMINPDVCDVHYEKALPEFSGAYAVINREFASRCTASLINREEDVGDEGLRYAKLSYRPVTLIRKLNAEPEAPHVFRPAEEGDLGELRALWKTCFGEAPEETELFFTKRMKLESTYVAATGDTVNAMLCLLPCKINRVQAHYLYGACTHPDRRNRGVMTDLVKYALFRAAEKGDALSLLLPADSRLYGFYGKLGYSPLYGTCEISLTADELNAAISEEYPSKEKTPARPDWGEDGLGYAKELASLYANLYSAEGCTAAVSLENETVRAEFLTHSPDGEKQILRELLKDYENYESFSLRVPSDSLTAKDAAISPFGMYLCLDEKAAKAVENGVFLSPALD